MKRLLSLLLLLTLPMAGACHRSSPGQGGTAQAADGTAIHYEVRGQGDPTLVFIHCWSCNRHYWDGQVAEFAKDHRVVTLDLGGHGESGKQRKDWTVASFVQDVTAVMDQLKISKAILVGHSMGGPISLAVAAARPADIRAIVCVDTLQNADQPPPRQAMEQAANQIEDNLPKAMQSFLPTFMPKDADPKVVAFVVGEASKADPKIAAALMRDLATLDWKPWLQAVKVPIRCISSAENLGPVKTDAAVNKKYADFEAIEMSGVGHFLQLEKPAEFNGWLRQILEQLD